MKVDFINGAAQLGDKSEIEVIHPVSGGDINESFYVRTKEQEYFVKLNKEVEKEFFTVEARGLQLIADTNTINVPNVYGVVKTNSPMLWLEWINGAPNKSTDVKLGERLAKMHLQTKSHFGYDDFTYIGKLRQENGWYNNWCTYYREQRLATQVRLGVEQGLIRGQRHEQLHKLLDRLEKWIPECPKGSLLHGDLWSGNWLAGAKGEPYLIDPSVLYGDHEFELAFTELFGGYSREFYESYQRVFPLSKEYKERKELYQLYYLLVHLNMFGESYGPSIDRILKKYVG
ncbi:fructosamine kinase family protein [Bacillus tianshenii]|nr:fructosamine kinase family protein [Bacillus tianshenii]